MNTKLLLRCLTAVILFIGSYLNSVLIMAVGEEYSLLLRLLSLGIKQTSEQNTPSQQTQRQR